MWNYINMKYGNSRALHPMYRVSNPLVAILFGGGGGKARS